MLFSTDYPTYLGPLGDEHETRPHPLLHAIQILAKYIGDFFALLFVTAFTGLEIVFALALVFVAYQGLVNWEDGREFISAVSQALSVWAR